MAAQRPRRAAYTRRAGDASLAAFLLLTAGASNAFFAWRGDVLAYGDAEAHLNIARKLWDNRHPAYRELGTVWLPLPHLLMLPFTLSDRLYRSGLAGAIPSGICWIAAGLLLYAAVRRLAGAWEPAVCAVAIYAFNPNLLYLAATPMTEPLFFMALAGLLHAVALYRDLGRTQWVLAAVFWTWCAALTRYEGWLLIPVVCLFFLAARRFQHAGLYGALASLAPLGVFAHNWWIYGDALEFYRGEWSPRAIYDRGHAGGLARFPGEGNLMVAAQYYLSAAQLVLGLPLLLIAASGSAVAIWKRWHWFVLMLLAVPVFTVWGMRAGGGVEIYVPSLWPHSYYNLRYALSLLPLAALSGATWVMAAPPRFRGQVAVGLVIAAMVPWVAFPSMENWAVWKEGQVNSIERRAWTHQLAAILHDAYQPGDRILYSFGDLTGVIREAGIPLKAGLQSGNDLEWNRTLARPDLFLDQQWVLDFEDGKAVKAASQKRYALFAKMTREHGAPAVILLRRASVDQ